MTLLLMQGLCTVHYMETENHHTAEQGKEAEVRCPICGAVAHACVRPGLKNSSVLIQKIYRTFYRTRTCQGCYFTFSRLIFAERLSLWLQPFVEPLFPSRRYLKSEHLVDQPVHIPSSPIRRGAPVQGKVETPAATAGVIRSPLSASVRQIPFVVDPVSRTVRVNLECPIGDGEFGGEILAAASFLEENLRSAADQIRALVDSVPSSLQVSQEFGKNVVATGPDAPVQSPSAAAAECTGSNSDTH